LLGTKGYVVVVVVVVYQLKRANPKDNSAHVHPVNN
jgi:hypothetical protein